MCANRSPGPLGKKGKRGWQPRPPRDRKREEGLILLFRSSRCPRGKGKKGKEAWGVSRTITSFGGDGEPLSVFLITGQRKESRSALRSDLCERPVIYAHRRDERPREKGKMKIRWPKSPAMKSGGRKTERLATGALDVLGPRKKKRKRWIAISLVN